ncbi:MAG: hypothetical protein PHH13_00020 [Candidatus Peribacteraceae bacterium]|nr:hypothetical protein [Candidatus Peribacteraceae bacterium]
MELSTFSTITGILVLLIGLPLLVAGASTAAFVQQLMRNALCMRITGAVIVILTVLALQQGYRIGTDTAGLLRLVAWIGLVKGITATWFPNVLRGLSERMVNSVALRPVFGAVAIVLGGLLLYGAQLV